MEKKSTTDHEGLSVKGKEANMDKAVTHDLLTVEIGTLKDQVTVNDHHLHGKFFYDRAEFYVVENPELYISDSEVKELTLYFIDGTLCKKKYQLAEDISADLIKAYGGFKFRPLNQRTKALSKSEKVVLKADGRNVLNEKLDRYQMKWNEEEVMIRYNLSKDSADTKIFLEEELTAYKNLLAMAQQELP